MVTTISFELRPAMNKSLHAVLVKICTGKDDPLLRSSARKILTVTYVDSTVTYNSEFVWSEVAANGTPESPPCTELLQMQPEGASEVPS